MSDQRTLKLSCRSNSFHMTDPNFQQNFIKNDTEFPSLSTNEAANKNAMSNASGCYITSTYSARLKCVNKNNDKVASQNENVKNASSNHYLAKYVKVQKMLTFANADLKESSLSKRNSKEYNNPHVQQSHEETKKKNYKINRSMISPNKNEHHKMISISDEAANSLVACDKSTNDIYSQTFKREDILNIDYGTMPILQPKNKPTVDAMTKVKNTVDCEAKIKTKKKNRKSKVKRDTTLQSGKLLLLTPEVHSRIFSKTNKCSTSAYRNSIVNINNDEEYPELGQAVLQKKSNSVKSLSDEDHKKLNRINYTVEIPSSQNIESNISNENEESEQASTKLNQKPVLSSSESSGVKKKKCKEEKISSHTPVSIIISLEDVLLAKSKAKEVKSSTISEVPLDHVYRVKRNKVVGVPHNVLDSSSPAVKRGKERENPKPKKKSQLKKIILMDRQHRKDQRFSAKEQNVSDNAESSNESVEKDLSLSESEKMESSDTLVSFNEIEQKMHELQLSCEISLQDNNTAEYFDEINLQKAEKLSTNNEANALVNQNDCSAGEQPKDCFNILTNFKPVYNDAIITESIERNLSHETSHDNILHTDDNELFLKFLNNVPYSSYENCRNRANSVTNFHTTSAYTEQEILQAAKIVIHTRNFRPYCKNVICKDLEKSTLALLDDLTRFQDRMHLKDPIKARVKRRLVNGIKEVMKNIKLRKLKCIIIATNIENVETEGGLNDTIENLASSASDHCIPCVYALHRKVLGRACHKPVGISCVGIFNYEGSEANFKKMMELQIESQKKYRELQENVEEKLNDSIIENLFKVHKSSPENLQGLRETVLSDVYKIQM